MSLPNVLRICAAASLLSGLACSNSNTPTANDRALSNRATDSSGLSAQVIGVRAHSPRGRGTLDDRLAALANIIPGFGGFFYDSSGTLTVYLKDPARLPEARPRIADFMREGHPRSAARLSRIAMETGRMRVRVGRYDFGELLRLYRSLVLPNISSLSGVTLTDISEGRNRILVGIENESQVGAARQLLVGLGVPSNALEITHIGRARPLAGRTRSPLSSRLRVTSIPLNDLHRPVYGGMRIEAYQSGPCSLGFNLMPFINGDSTSDRYFITAAHCVLPQNTNQGVGTTTVAQPYTNTADIGVKAADHTWFTNAQAEDCPTGDYCRISDAALVKYYTASHGNNRSVAFPATDNGTSFISTAAVTDLDDAYEGQRIYMIGASSGRQPGQVTSACAYVYFPDHYTMICQGIGDFDATDGDSGAPVVATTNNWPITIGLGIVSAFLPQGGIVFSLLPEALTELYDSYPSLGLMDPTMDAPSYSPAFQVSINGPTTVGPNNYSCAQWIASVQGGSSPFSYSWSGLVTSDQYFAAATVPQSGGDLLLMVTDNAEAEVGLWLHVTYDPNNQDYCT